MIDETAATFNASLIVPFDPRKTPSAPPPLGVFDEPTYSICINAQWWSHVIGVVERLAWRDAWDAVPEEQQRAVDETVKILGAIGNAITCGENSMFRLRQNSANPCLMEQSLDGGETWVTAFNYALCSQGTSIDIDAGIQIIINNTTIYNTDPDDFRPEIEAADADTNTAICHALNVLIRACLATLIARKQADYTNQILIQTAAGVIGTASAFIFGTPVAGLAVAIGTAAGLIGTAIIDGVDDDDLQAVLNSDARIKELVCCAYGALEGTRPTPTSLGDSLDGCDFTTVVDNILPAMIALFEDFDTFVQFLDIAGMSHQYAAAGVLGNACTDLCNSWEAFIDFEATNGGFIVSNGWQSGASRGSWVSGDGWNTVGGVFFSGWAAYAMPRLDFSTPATLTGFEMDYNVTAVGIFSPAVPSALLIRSSAVAGSATSLYSSNAVTTGTGTVKKGEMELEPFDAYGIGFSLWNAHRNTSTSPAANGTARVKNLRLTGIGDPPTELLPYLV